MIIYRHNLLFFRGNKRSFHNRYEDPSATSMTQRPEFNRSLSSDNWRGRDDPAEQDESDWRRAGNTKWGKKYDS